MKKVMSALAVSAMLMSALPTSVMDAAARISIYINDAELSSAQAPVMKGGRVLVPLRSIFEGLDAKVQYTNRTKTIVATRDDQEVTLTLGSKTAYINGEAISLDVPANTIKGNTMVPIRFVSEAFGEKVFWNSRNQRVDIKTTATPPVDETQYAAWNIYGSVSGSNGDGRDLTVSFTRPTSEKAVSAYRIMLVKTRDVNTFTESAASAVPSANYTSVTPNGSNPKLTLNAQTRDVNGDLLNSNETYRLYVLTVGNSSNNYKNALNWSSQALKLNIVKSTVQAVTSLRAADISDYGDGRDLEINFTQPSTTSNITYYRAFVVKAKDSSAFNLAAANKVSSANSTIIYKGNTAAVKSQLTSSTRDTSGELIKSGTAYVVYILSVSTNTTTDSKLSAASSSLTLSVNTATSPVITQVRDNSDYGDGRDIQVSFNRSSDESKVANYRVFVVRNSVASSFNLTTASNLSSSLYYTVNKTGNNITTTLPSSMKDTSGYNVTNLQDYRIYVMAVGNQQNGYTNALSASSTVLRLTTNGNAGVISNLAVADIGDYGDGRDLRVSFNKAADESRISAYRVYVVRSANVGSFTLSAANASSNYTQVNKTGGNLSFTLPNYAVDTNGYTITNNVAYRVFVLSVNNNGNSSQNALSGYSSQITLSQNAAITAPSNVGASDIGDTGDGRDLRVTFNKSADETNVNHYRVFVVKNANAGSFNLNAANAVTSSNYTYVSRTGNNQTITLSNGSRTVDGDSIRNDVGYRVYVMAVNNNASLTNALSSPSGAITLTSNATVEAVGKVEATVKDASQAAGNVTDVTVKFTKPGNETGIKRYVLMVVPAATAFDLNAAKTTANSNFATVVNTSPTDLPLSLKDSNGVDIKAGVSYKVYILSESSDSKWESNLASSPVFTINAKKQAPTPVEKVTGVNAAVTDNSINVSFTKPTNEAGIARYDVYIVKEGGSTGTSGTVLTTVSTGTAPWTATVGITAKDSDNVDFGAGKYRVLVVAVASDTSLNTSVTSEGTLTIPPASSGTDQGADNTGKSSNQDTDASASGGSGI
ncbi:stalk domain-containing protein [Paenibacillus sp. SAF-068]|uniref:stalk domain-containing protein n=1 Tax=Paenibacillus sp. SAF-068 TaxID=3436864 RepID=UPI003F812178